MKSYQEPKVIVLVIQPEDVITTSTIEMPEEEL